MAKFIRYALATVCFAGCVACLALWGWTMTHESRLYTVRCLSPTRGWHLDACEGTGIFTATLTRNQLKWECSTDSGPFPEWDAWFSQQKWPQTGVFGVIEWKHFAAYFPLWYPALVFALAGVGVLRFRRQFSIRSALICVSVVAALLGMVVAL